MFPYTLSLHLCGILYAQEQKLPTTDCGAHKIRYPNGYNICFSA